MTALILVVDDVPANVKLLEAKLSNEYYDVITAKDGHECIEQAKKHKPDLVLLDVMMPGLDGFETCRRLKADVDVSHIPVVMVTALSEISDRIQGLEAGADDFITKPINDMALFARVRSLVRIKVLLDELRLREKTGMQMGVLSENQNIFTSDVSGAHIIVVDDDAVQANRISEALKESYRITTVGQPNQARDTVLKHAGDIDLIVISTQLTDMDGLRLSSQLKSMEEVRHVPIVMMVDEDDTQLMLKGLELGINDYLILPIDVNEMKARVKTQIRRRKYQEALKANYQQSVSMAITDKLTGLYNRHYLDIHLQNVVAQALQNRKNLSLVILDMDHFKAVNDTYGHDVGDEVLRQLAEIITGSIRSSDTPARLGGEEFLVMMPETDFKAAYEVAERMRKKVEAYEFKISHAEGMIHKTVSIGLSALNLDKDAAADVVKRADVALYEAKHSGRNKVLPLPDAPKPARSQVAAVGGAAAKPKPDSGF